MSWNYRVIRGGDPGGVYYAIHEVYYDADGEPNGWCEADALADTRDDLFSVLERMNEAAKKPVLEVREGKLVEVEPAIGGL
jgi:hypothetical protein